jgi:hypothetical protein
VLGTARWLCLAVLALNVFGTQRHGKGIEVHFEAEFKPAIKQTVLASLASPQ